MLSHGLVHKQLKIVSKALINPSDKETNFIWEGAISEPIYEIELSDLSYEVLENTQLKHGSHLEKLGQLYEFWKETWRAEFEKSGNPESHWREHFFKHDIVTAIFHKTEPIVCHLYSFFDLNFPNVKEREYFVYVSEVAMERMKNKGNQKVMTMEYLCASPQVSRNSLKISMSRLMVALGNRLCEEMGVDCSLGMPISGTSVKTTTETLGGYVLETDIKKYGYSLDFIAMPTQPRVPCSEESVENIAAQLWKKMKLENQEQESKLAA